MIGDISKNNIMQDINENIFKRGEERLKYDLLDGTKLIVSVKQNLSGPKQLQFEKVDEFDNKLESFTRDYYNTYDENIMDILKFIIR